MAQRPPRNSYSDERRRPDGYEPASRRPEGRPPQYREGRPPQYREGRPPQYRESRPPQYRDGRPPQRRRKKKKGKGGLIAVIIIIVLLAAAAFAAWKSGVFNKVEEVIEEVKPVPAEPKVISSATIGATGDILLHTPILNAHATYDDFDFNFCFQNVAKIYQQPDLMIANFEVTLGGPEYGEYTAYPSFNSPDAIVPALLNAGVDLCLTANNHSYDTGNWGMERTLDVMDEYGMEHIGTRKNVNDHYLMVKNINGIRLGLICYTYDTREYTEWMKSLNGIVMSDEAVDKVNSFSYEALDEFYADLQHQLDNMDMLNCDAKVVFMHWGTEYQDYSNDQQDQIAQRLCDMGVDVIIGGHPHVIQQFETLTSPTGHQTICLYSMGNELSNQRRDLMEAEDFGRGYTEDGLVMQVTFDKFNNGKVKVGAVNIVPTWVELDGWGYQIIGLDGSNPQSWGAADVYSATESYNRTIGRVGEGYINYRNSKHQSEIVEYIE